MKIPDERLAEIRKAYEGCESMASIGDRLGCTRQAVWKFLKRHGVEMSTTREVVCGNCGERHRVYRSVYSKTKKHFCDDVCYHVYLENRDSVVNRQKQRVARYKVSQVFELLPEHVVHHKDSNHFNTQLDNFMVFANHSDHLRYHHQVRQGEVSVAAVWEGGQ